MIFSCAVQENHGYDFFSCAAPINLYLSIESSGVLNTRSMILARRDGWNWCHACGKIVQCERQFVSDNQVRRIEEVLLETEPPIWQRRYAEGPQYCPSKGRMLATWMCQKRVFIFDTAVECRERWLLCLMLPACSARNDLDKLRKPLQKRMLGFCICVWVDYSQCGYAVNEHSFVIPPW